MNKKHIYTLKIDSDFDKTFKEFKKQLNKDESIVDMNIVEGVCVVETSKKQTLLKG